MIPETASSIVPYIYVLVRTDLPPSHRACQAIHASITSARSFPIPVEHPNLVVLGVSDEPALAAARERLKQLGVPHVAYHEPDLGGQLTAVATAPRYGVERRVFREYKLLK